jgi:hypothetical protein
VSCSGGSSGRLVIDTGPDTAVAVPDALAGVSRTRVPVPPPDTILVAPPTMPLPLMTSPFANAPCAVLLTVTDVEALVVVTEPRPPKPRPVTTIVDLGGGVVGPEYGPLIARSTTTSMMRSDASGVDVETLTPLRCATPRLLSFLSIAQPLIVT